MSKYLSIQAERMKTSAVQPTNSVITAPALAPIITLVTPEVIEQVKDTLKAQKMEEQKKKKRDYQREYMRTYKKDVPKTDIQIARKRLLDCLAKIEPSIAKTLLAEYLAKMSS